MTALCLLLPVSLLVCLVLAAHLFVVHVLATAHPKAPIYQPALDWVVDTCSI